MLQLVTHDRDLLRKQVDKLSTERANVVVPLHHRQLSQPQLSKVGTDRGTGKLDDERTINIPVLIFFLLFFRSTVFSLSRFLRDMLCASQGAADRVRSRGKVTCP